MKTTNKVADATKKMTMDKVNELIKNGELRVVCEKENTKYIRSNNVELMEKIVKDLKLKIYLLKQILFDNSTRVVGEESDFLTIDKYCEWIRIDDKNNYYQVIKNKNDFDEIFTNILSIKVRQLNNKEITYEQIFNFIHRAEYVEKMISLGYEIIVDKEMSIVRTFLPNEKVTMYNFGNTITTYIFSIELPKK